MRIDNKYTRAIGHMLIWPFVPIFLLAFTPLFVMCWFEERFIVRKREWHDHFLWLPKQIGFEGRNGVYIWLETIERQWWGNSYEYRRKSNVIEGGKS